MDPKIRRIRMLRKSWFRAFYLAARGQELRRQGRDQSREPQRGHFPTLGGRNLENISVPQLSRCRAEKIKSKRNVAFALRHFFVIRHSLQRRSATADSPPEPQVRAKSTSRAGS